MTDLEICRSNTNDIITIMKKQNIFNKPKYEKIIRENVGLCLDYEIAKMFARETINISINHVDLYDSDMIIWDEEK